MAGGEDESGRKRGRGEGAAAPAGKRQRRDHDDAALAPAAAADGERPRWSPPAELRCAACGRPLPAAEFSPSQLRPRKVNAGKQTCQRCLAPQQAAEAANVERSTQAKKEARAARLAERASALLEQGVRWEPSLCAAAEVPADGPLPPAPALAAELLQQRAVHTLRRRLHLLAKSLSEGARKPLLAFERWQARAALRGASLIPSPPASQEERMWVDKGLVRDLARASGRSDADGVAAAAKAGARELSQKAAELAAEVAAARGAAAAGAADIPDIKEEWSRGVGRFSAPGAREYLEIGRGHYSKLYTLYNRGAAPSEAEFRYRLWCLLSRYSALGGHGYQAAVSARGFDVLREHLGVNFECFASPLNARFPRHCSAFADTDAPFGSLGSFWKFQPVEGSYEANPPYVPEVMSATVDRIEMLLGASARPLSFAVVIPAWKEVAAWAQLERCQWSRFNLEIPAEDHGFVDGKQHTSADGQPPRPSSYDTAVFVLQNDAGAAKWPTTGLGPKLLDAFAASKDPLAPTIGEYERRVRGGAAAEGAAHAGGRPRRRRAVLVD
eukprot:TRINITY_DN22709_c0_g1_i1.p1 TRINITY_DN22709_c0_g1~~TRINITY_DN22709_c0_g1_i1.p1  ORF type:complete len:612 (+),score=141.92 TRINITY_DN22709_c0_g1_i1:170-1837(+)